MMTTQSQEIRKAAAEAAARIYQGNKAPSSEILALAKAIAQYIEYGST